MYLKGLYQTSLNSNGLLNNHVKYRHSFKVIL